MLRLPDFLRRPKDAEPKYIGPIPDRIIFYDDTVKELGCMSLEGKMLYDHEQMQVRNQIVLSGRVEQTGLVRWASIVDLKGRQIKKFSVGLADSGRTVMFDDTLWVVSGSITLDSMIIPFEKQYWKD